MNPRLPMRQNGATLFVALIMLLIITVLALSSVREATLETRITGNFTDQQKLINLAEAGLREGENLMTARHKPASPDCAPQDDEGSEDEDSTKFCFVNMVPSALPSFEDDETACYAPLEDGTCPVRWYALPQPAGEAQGESENPEYGNMMLGIGTFRYEINTTTKNDATGQSASLRTTVAKVFD